MNKLLNGRTKFGSVDESIVAGNLEKIGFPRGETTGPHGRVRRAN